MTESAQPSFVEALAKQVRRGLVPLLLGCYALGAILPEWGVQLGAFDLAEQFEQGLPLGVPARFSLLMVAVLLFCGAVSIELSRLTELASRPFALALGLLLVWLPSVTIVLLLGMLASLFGVSEDGTSLGLLLGLALTAAMPVANSAIGWTHQSVGSLPWAIGLVVLSITLAPWVAPALMTLLGLSLSPSDAARAEQLVAQFSGTVLLFWVLGPTLLGFVVRAVLGAERVKRVAPWLALASATALLLLNYVNAAQALPQLVTSGLDLLTFLMVLFGATLLPVVGQAVGQIVASMLRLPAATRAAWGFSLGMKNTGLALGVASTALADQPIAVLVILVGTLAQHLVAGAAHRTGSKACEVKRVGPASSA